MTTPTPADASTLPLSPEKIIEIETELKGELPYLSRMIDFNGDKYYNKDYDYLIHTYPEITGPAYWERNVIFGLLILEAEGV